MAKTLEMQFKNEDGKTTTISIENPIEPVDAGAVSAAMDLIVSTNVFLTPGGAIVEKKGARVVERNVATVEM
ncbi:DUF2922 domain-containing protein [Fredinandcohnia sp. QZ13]|uniref:DUF2922 domain-containing protein n=1 Tax=Fredinandcohnia sp. QZ13 TaxID=3073144 RepID=UPI0028531387|nr:DUF2922 domain-containing protein [Fredinandcohnia sp. QZ13]MDR4890142.1 DUF2922 domain-containing protein [Fredinandcohnia sp. QZ13]